jgi:hypothetical protein
VVPLKKIVLLLAAVLLTSACGGAGKAEPKTSPTPKPLEQAKATCAASSDAVEVGDGGKTLTIDGKGKKDFSGLETTQVVCILKALKVSDAVISQMDSTRALDGRQSAEWEGYSASWTYHPDAGLDVIVTQKR